MAIVIIMQLGGDAYQGGGFTEMFNGGYVMLQAAAVFALPAGSRPI